MRSAAWGILPLLLAACVRTPRSALALAPGAASTPVVILPVAGPPLDEGAPTLPDAAPECVSGALGPRCEGLVGPTETIALGGAIDAAQKAVLDSSYADVHALARLARLQLRRDEDGASPDGASDAARGLKNAMRAVAVDDGDAEARLTLALALARSLQIAGTGADPTLRGLSLDLVGIALEAVPKDGPSAAVAASADTLAGYLEIERGRTALAQAAFASATRVDPDLGTAWVGLGDAARVASDFDDATAAYQRAAARLRTDGVVVRALEAAAHKQAPLRGPSLAPGPFARGPLAPPPPPPPRCSSTQARVKEEADLCRGLERLASASTRADQEEGATLVLNGWRAMLPLCEAADPACGPHVAEAMAAVSRAFQAAGRPAKSIASAQLLLGRSELPGSAALAPALALELGDRYFALGIFDHAAEWYARHVQVSKADAGPAADRALRLHVALGDVDAATALADALSRDGRQTEEQRASWVILTAAVVRARRGPSQAVSWLSRHRALLDRAGASAAAAEASKPVAVTDAKTASCAAPLSCAVRRLAGERW